MRTFLQWTLPVVVAAFGVLVAAYLIRNRPEVETQRPEAIPPLVRVAVVEPGEQRFTVRSQGTVKPRTEVRLVSEVRGRVTEVSPALTAGGFFEEGQVLVRIDPRDYAFAEAGAVADVARAKLALERAEAEADVARREWEDLGTGDASELALHGPQLAEARAAVAAAEAALGLARLDLERTEVRAPFSGRVRSERVDVGQFLNHAEEVAVIYAIDRVEVRLPVRDAELAALDLESGPRVNLTADFAGAPRTWIGHIVRTEGELDPKTRMVALVAEVEDPYGVRTEGAEVPLAIGMFVEAEVLGSVVDGVVALPRSALRGDDRVLVVDDEERLWSRPVDVLRVAGERIYVAAGEDGLAAGERVCLSPLATVIEGMRVRAEAAE